MHKPIYLLCALMITLPTVAKAQPKLYLNDHQELPAISRNHAQIAVLHDEIGYDGNRNYTLTFYDCNSSEVVDEIAIYAGPAKKIVDSPLTPRRLAKANNLLKGFTKLEPLPLITQKEGPFLQFAAPHASIVMNQKTAAAVELPTSSYTDPVCTKKSDISLNCNVTRNPEVTGAWLSQDQKVAVVVYGYYSGRDGYELGPLYKIVKITAPPPAQ